MKIIEEAKKETERRRELQAAQSRIEKRETMFDTKLLEFEDSKTKLQQKIEDVQKAKEKVDLLRVDADKKLEEISKLSKEQAVETLLDRVSKDSKNDLMGRITKIEKREL